VYRYPAGEKLTYRFTGDENGQKLHRYWTNACRNCSLKSRCTLGPQRRVKRWEHEDVLEAVQKRLDENPHATRTRRETSEHPFGTMDTVSDIVRPSFRHKYAGGEEVPYSVTMGFYNSRRVPRRLQDPILAADLKELALRLSPRMLLRVMPRLRRNSPGVCPVQRRKARTKWLGSA
jgi:Transposase DDE domain